LNDNTQNDPNDIVQNDLNGPFTKQDIAKDRRVYELLQRTLENSLYDHSAFIINNVNATHFTVKLPNSKDCILPLKAVQPLIAIHKCNALFFQF